MSKIISLIPVNLQMFAEGSAAAGGGTAGNGTMGATATDAMSQVSDGSSNKVTAEPSSQATDGNTPDLDAEFEKLIKGDYKEQFNKRVENTVKKRLKNSKETETKLKETEAKLQATQPALQLLAEYYNVNTDDISGLVKAIQNDDRYLEEEAMKQGLDVNVLRRMKSAERERDVAIAQRDAQIQDQQRREEVSRWYKDFETNVKSVYPNITFDDAMQNEQFIKMMHLGIDALSAVTALNAREAIPAAMEAAAQSATKKVTDNIRANQGRPNEGAAMSSAAVVTKSDVSSLSNADVEKILDRVRSGEKDIDLVNKF